VRESTGGPRMRVNYVSFDAYIVFRTLGSRINYIIQLSEPRTDCLCIYVHRVINCWIKEKNQNLGQVPEK